MSHEALFFFKGSTRVYSTIGAVFIKIKLDEHSNVVNCGFCSALATFGYYIRDTIERYIIAGISTK